ncbi:hypothetical protein CSB45_05385 [candidate division KSB3 bacterium]|uniref:Glucosamine inositolphosphorylceramide transferase 1 N-terminal domain-containing protein n=1 Tax=candidate division KSB3 bacterium TaxID=2044937 RepID=A0A2G6E7Q4_9BACT|nr:MAG: hypothetical protein CSB45_05385 [candidate division KSB3 bacterium]PIE30480.1 MAG: hypothetical protein CSA57_04150 [candidate division KSB3 bacterium]
MKQHRLRIGLLIDTYDIPQWAFRMVEEIHQSHYARIVLLIKNDALRSTQQTFFQKLKEHSQRILYIGLMKLEQQIFRITPDAFATQNISGLFSDLPCIHVRPQQKNFSDYLCREDIDTIKGYNLDVLVRLGFRILRGEILHAAKYGVWSYHHGDSTVNRGGPAGFWEVFEGWKVTGSILQILTEDLDNGMVLCRSQSQTDRLSVIRGNNSRYWNALYFLPRKLEELYTLGEEAFFLRVHRENQHPCFYSRRLYRTPTNLQMLALALKHYSGYLLKKFTYLCSSYQWILLFRIHQHQGASTSLWRFKKMIPPKDRAWADPFVVLHGGSFYVFIEEFMNELNRAHISYFTIDMHGKCSVPKQIIQQPYHLSYPFVFMHNGTYYLIPESSENRSIELYQCVNFPEKWERVHVMMENVRAFDTTLFQRGGTWFLFTNMQVHAGTSSWDELFLFYSTELFSGHWIPHPQNPVVSDVSSARPAGRVFLYNKHLYRPSQDSSHRYGYGIKINQILTLTESEYREVCVNHITPEWDKSIIATHTINFADRLTVIDGLVQRSRFWRSGQES